jgi:hypothetical protein
MLSLWWCATSAKWRLTLFAWARKLKRTHDKLSQPSLDKRSEKENIQNSITYHAKKFLTCLLFYLCLHIFSVLSYCMNQNWHFLLWYISKSERLFINTCDKFHWWLHFLKGACAQSEFFLSPRTHLNKERSIDSMGSARLSWSFYRTLPHT